MIKQHLPKGKSCVFPTAECISNPKSKLAAAIHCSSKLSPFSSQFKQHSNFVRIPHRYVVITGLLFSGK